MAMLNFDATHVPQAEGRMPPIPEGWYTFMVDESEIKAAKDPQNAYLKVRCSVVDGEYANRKVYKNFNIKNSNPTAQEIGFKELSSLAHSVGVLVVQDSQQLHGIPFRGQVKIRAGGPKDEQNPNAGTYDPQNEIVTIKHINDPAAQNAPGSAAPAAYTPPAAGGAAPAAGAPSVPWATKPAAPAAAPAAPATGMPAQPWAQPAAAAPAPAPAAPPPPPPPPPAAPPAFPPAGWTAHPTAPGFFYQGQEVLSEADLRAKFAAPPPAPAAPPAPPATPAAPSAGNPAAAQTMAPPWARPPA